jgi:DNA repair photolyase
MNFQDESYLFQLPESASEITAEDEASINPASSKLVGIAKLASEGESVRVGHDVEYFTLEAKSILNRCTAKRMPFTWTINPYRGCEFACKYCYARYTHEFMEMRDNIEFERKIYIKQNVGWLLRQDLKKVKPNEEIAIGTATDPYQPAEKRYEMTRSILEELTQHRGLNISFVTKSDLITRDIDLLKQIAEHNTVFVNVTITTMNVQLARILEPRAPRPDLRMKAVRELNEAGVDAGVICAPVLPGITDTAQSLEMVVAEAKRAGAKYIFANPLFLKPCSASVFLPFIEKEFPHLVEEYRSRYGERAYPTKAYGQRIKDLMKKLRQKYAMHYNFAEKKRRGAVRAEQEEEQLDLFYELKSTGTDSVPIHTRRRQRTMS